MRKLSTEEGGQRDPLREVEAVRDRQTDRGGQTAQLWVLRRLGSWPLFRVM